MYRMCLRWGMLFCLLVVTRVSVTAGGISADAGLTPAEDRLIFRTQVRYIKRGNDPTMMDRHVEMYMFPAVLAYGLRSDLTLIARQMVMRRSMTMRMNINMPAITTRSTGLGDLMLMAKYRAVRINKPNYTFGVAPVIGIELPTGEDDFTSDGYDLKTGLYFSGRVVPWASDLAVSYTLNGLAGDADRGENQVLEIIGAVARQISLTEDARTALAPVVEFSYEHASVTKIDGVENPNSGESMIKLAPGMKLTLSSVILEALLWVPVWQDQNGTQLEQKVSGLFGVRVML